MLLFFCWASYSEEKGILYRAIKNAWAYQGDKDNYLRLEKKIFGDAMIALPTPASGNGRFKSDIPGTIFGFLAAIAVTKGFQTYYDFYIRPLVASQGGIFVALTENLNPIPTLHLFVIFVVAIPLTHFGYLLLSSLITYRDKPRAHAGLLFILVICIIEAAFLYFLGGSIVNPQVDSPAPQVNSTLQQEDPITQLEEANTPDQSNAFVFWLTLIMVMATAASSVFKRIIEGNRILWEWISLYGLTAAFLVVVLIILFQLGDSSRINDLTTLFWTEICLLCVLITRSVLDYYLGEGIYFPEIFKFHE